ncbi:MAG: S46 family peptidase [Bacteroidales bacterium]|nr:S46 family peptidase [Bacteroidales bacterium]
MKKILLFALLFSFSLCSFADEGMWIPMLLKKNEADMQKKGFKLTAEDVYSINHSSMKDAVVLFGGGCTGEIISSEGLLLTNHHCGYWAINSISTVEHNYLHNGFWAKSKEEEIPLKGQKATFLIRMEDVTNAVLEGVTDKMKESEKQEIIRKNVAAIRAKAVEGTHYEAVIKPFFYGNQYFMFVNEVFPDIRLVGTPPESIGKFGGDTDNWMWPRHTGDFSMYRIYADKNGNPAPYSPDNVPYHPKRHFTISTKGVNENDFTMVFGYPGSTQQFLISDGVEIVAKHQNPVAVDQRTTRLDIMKKYMNMSTELRLKFSARSNSVANAWKKWIGETKGITECHVVERKVAEEKEFTNWVNQNADRQQKYGNVLPALKNEYAQMKNYVIIYTYISETFKAIDVFNYMDNFASIVEKSKLKETTNESLAAEREALLKKTQSYFKGAYKPMDKEIFAALLHYYFTHIDPMLIAPDLQRYIVCSKADFEKMANHLFDETVFASEEQMTQFITNGTKKDFAKLEKLEAFRMYQAAFRQYDENIKKYAASMYKINDLYRVYVKALMEKDADKTFYPDANLTLRVAYGNIKGFSPADGIEYQCYTTLDGVMQKENPDIFDYKVHPRLKELYEKKDYGRYANSKGELPVCFVATNHTTGGNSGSPVIDANGRLIGVNFDRVWEGTMSDINYDVDRCRNISLDIRYFLFIVDKFAGAQNLINEMTLE